MFFKFIAPEQTVPANSARLKWLVAGAILLVTGVLVGGATWAALAIPTGRAEAAVLATSTPPSTNWQWQNPLPQGNDLNAVTCVTQDECYAVGDRALMKTVPSQNGNDWQPLNAGFTTTLTGVGCTAPGHCLAVGYYGTVLRTSDSGQTWISSSDTITASHHLSRVVCLNDGSNTCYAADYSNLFKTTDSGQTWTTISLSTTGGGAITGLGCPDANTCYLIQGSKFSKTTDGGTTWATQALPSASQPSSPEQYSETSCPTVQTCYLVHKISQGSIGGPYGYYRLAKTTDGGITWATLYTPTTNPTATAFTNINCPDSDTCYAVLERQSGKLTIDKSTDGGITWVEQDLSTYTYSPITQVNCITVTSCYAVGTGGKLYHTADGQQWQNQLKGFFNTVHGIRCVDALNCYLISPSVHIPGLGVYTYTNYLVTTNDGGSTWVSQTQGSISGPPFGDMACPVINTCYVNGTGKIYKTTDGGQSWITLTNGITSTNLAKINCPSQQVCYSTVYTGSVIFGTTDGGQNWVSQAITASNTTAIDCPDVKICYAGWGTDVFKTTDGGQTWNYQAYITGTQNPSVRNLTCPTTQVCYTAANTYFAYACKGSLTGQPNPYPPCYASFKTIDGGLTWSSTTTSSLYALSCPSVSICYDGYSYTTDGATNWKPLNAPIPAYSIDCPLSCTFIGNSSEIVSNFDPQQLNSLELSGPSRVTIGQPVSFTLRAKTASNSVAASYTGTVHFGSSDSQGVIPADYDYTAADGGSHVFTVTFNTLGSQSLGVNDTFYTRLLKTSAAVNVVPPCNPYSVTSSSDDGGATDCGTLSYALSQAGVATNPVTITFSSPVITLTSALPTITPTVAVRIEGSCNLSGTLGLPGTRLVAGNNSISTAITLTSGMSLNGVGISGFSGYGVVVAGDNNTLTCNQIGPAGSYTGNGGGIKLVGSGNRLGLDGVTGSGNLIGGNQQASILVTNGSRGNRAVYNRVGFGLDGLTKLANGRALLVQPGGQLLVGPGNRFQG